MLRGINADAKGYLTMGEKLIEVDRICALGLKA